MTIQTMFKKFNRWLAVFFDDIQGKPVHYEDKEVVIGGNHYRVVQGRTLDSRQLVTMERSIYGTMPWDEQAFEIDLSRPNTLYLLLIDKQTTEMVAFIGAAFNAYSRDVHITNIGVVPKYQMHGLGSFLIHEIEAKARRDQFLSMSLEVRRSNITAQRLYGHLGFIKSQVRVNYYRDDGEDAFDMLKKLDEKGNYDGR